MKCYGKYQDADIEFHYTLDPVPDPASFCMHTHERCELYCILSGRGVFRIEGSEYHLEPGDLLVMRPAEAHCIEPDPSLPYERAALHFHPSLLSSLDPEGLLLKPFYDRDPGRFNLFRDSDFPDLSHRLYVSNLLRTAPDRRVQLLCALVPLLNELYQISLRREGSPWREDDSLMHQIIRHINSNLSSPLSLSDLCDRFFISKPQLCRSFKRATGASVGEYITVKRLLNARSMLAAGTPPTRVCTACGFNDYSAFYRAYRKRFGVSPQRTQQDNGGMEE